MPLPFPFCLLPSPPPPGAARRLVLAAALVSACGSSPAAPEGPLPIVRLRPDAASLTTNGGYGESRRIVVRTASEWQDVWKTIWQYRIPPPPLPSVDFAREMVVVAAMGAQSSGGYSITIESASENAGEVVVRVRSVSPAPSCIVTLAITRPVDAVRLPRRDGDVRFEERSETRECS